MRHQSCPFCNRFSPSYIIVYTFHHKSLGKNIFQLVTKIEDARQFNVSRQLVRSPRRVKVSPFCLLSYALCTDHKVDLASGRHASA